MLRIMYGTNVLKDFISVKHELLMRETYSRQAINY